MKKYLIFTLAVFAFVLVPSCNKQKKDKDKEDENVIVQKIPDGLQAVDLGLSVLWANMNVGATKPDEVGYCFSWGENIPRQYGVRPADYKWNDQDGPLTWAAEDDPAATYWGDGWRVPTEAEMFALVSLSFTERNGFYISGNGNSIFVPFPDSRFSMMNLWTSTRSDDNPVWAYYGSHHNNVSNCRREFAYPVRPVKDK